MIFRQYQPSPSLSAFVKCYWLLECDHYPGPPERILPDGCTELIFHYGDSYSRVTDDGLAEQERILLVGQIKSAIQLQANGVTGMLGVRFHPWGLAAFTGMPSSELTGHHLDAQLLFKEAGGLGEQIYSSGHDEMITLVEKFLVDLLKKQKRKLLSATEGLGRVVERMINEEVWDVPGAASIANMSVRQFNRKFNEVTGLSPKHFLRINRIQKFIANYRRVNDTPTLNSLIYECGYYDPAHFSRDFKDIAGVNPSEYFGNLQSFGAAMLL